MFTKVDKGSGSDGHEAPVLPPQPARAYHQVQHLSHTFEPPRGYKLKKKRRWPWVVLALLALVAVGGALTKPTGSPSSTGAGSTPTPAGVQTPQGVGATATTSGIAVTLLQSVDPWSSTNQFEVPAAGHRFVAVELNMVNTTAELVTFSSVLGLEVIDSLGQRWPITFAGVDLPSAGGDIAPGTNLRGWAVFDLPLESTGLQLRVSGSLTATGSLFTL